jgi:hypothetical protein
MTKIWSIEFRSRAQIHAISVLLTPRIFARRQLAVLARLVCGDRKTRHSSTRMILIRLIPQMLCLFHSSCRLLYRRLAATDYSSQTARTWKTARLEEQKEDHNTSYRVKHFEKLLMQTDSGLNNHPYDYYFLTTGNTITIHMTCCLQTTLTTVITE